MDERKLDGNAAGGLLAEIFMLETTTAQGACDRCGTVAHVGEAMAYLTEIGTVLRCTSCDNALVRVAQNPRGHFLDLRGFSYLQFGSAP